MVDRLAGGSGRVPRRPLPLPVVPTGRTGAVVYGMSALDTRGRIADFVVVAALRREPGRQLEIGAVRAVVTIRAAADGKACVTSQGYLRLPAIGRHLCGLEPGDRVLLVADPQKQMMRLYPPATLDRLLAVEDTAPAGVGRDDDPAAHARAVNPAAAGAVVGAAPDQLDQDRAVL